MVSAAGPLAAAGSPWTKLVQGLVFGVALTLVVTAGGELATSNMMTLTQGAIGRTIGWRPAAGTLAFSFVGNLVGAFIFAFMVHSSGVLAPETPAGKMLAGMLATKAEEPSSQLFWRGVLCNMLVCLAMWSAARLRSEGAQLFVTVSADLVAQGIDAAALVREAVDASGGRGGGRPEMAQGRVPDPAALAAAIELLREHLAG
jgi:nitrite transporter NirC